MTNFTIETLINHPELVEFIPSSQVSLILSAVTNHAAAAQSRLAAVQSRLAARILSEGLCATETDDDRMLTAEAAKRLNYRLQYVYQLVRENRLGAKREGRKIRIRWGDLKVYMRDGTHHQEVIASQKPFERDLRRTRGSNSERQKIEIYPQDLGADPSRLPGPRRHRAEIHHPPRARGDEDPGSAGSPGSADIGGGADGKGRAGAWGENPSIASTTGGDRTTGE
jgi:excisionase family DNA binding protein